MSLVSEIPDPLLRLQDVECAANVIRGKLYEKEKDADNLEKTNCILNGSNGDVDFPKDKMQAVYKIATSLGFASPSKEHQESYYGVFIPQEVRMQWGEGKN